ncbi:MAG: hypothetical protein FRX48_04589 [Lasallia pustulata]|uniref:F-box domain-containing protein n=1 Tax=Lasallia pustulata TaxID=136370 RepID=A0A5M8PQR9_9LECA|nr:MAG: hypothetical protein FRX48_04589 [Lasallia pustulata]
MTFHVTIALGFLIIWKLVELLNRTGTPTEAANTTNEAGSLLVTLASYLGFWYLVAVSRRVSRSNEAPKGAIETMISELGFMFGSIKVLVVFIKALVILAVFLALFYPTKLFRQAGPSNQAPTEMATLAIETAVRAVVAMLAVTLECLSNFLDSVTSSDQQQQTMNLSFSHFQQLPVALRDMIVSYALPQDTVQLTRQSPGLFFWKQTRMVWLTPQTRPWFFFWKKTRMVRPLRNQLLCVRKEFEIEGTRLLYKSIRVHGEDLNAFHGFFLQKIGEKNVGQLQHLEIHQLRESSNDKTAETLERIIGLNPELNNLESLTFSAKDSRYLEELDQGEWDGKYLAGRTRILPRLNMMIVKSNSVTLKVGPVEEADGQYADLPFAFWALKRLDHDMRNDPKRASYGKFHGTPAAIVLKLWELDRWTTLYR